MTPHLNPRRAAALFASATGACLLLSGFTAVTSARPKAPRVKVAEGGTPVAAPSVAGVSFKDLAGKSYGTPELSRAKATVFVFTSTECPIAGKYTPRLVELAKDYAGKGVSFFLVNSNGGDSRDKFAKWVKERKFPFPAVKDEGTVLADKLGATTTPQAFVVDPAGSIAYIGRIDDNAEREKVTRQDLREALDDVLAGKPVRRSRTRAVGCGIFRDSAAPKVAATAKVTYARDIAPILNQNCVTCHRAGDVGPFALENYQQARTWASSIKEYTSRRLMPPWKAVPGHGDFADSRWLSDKELATLAAWSDAGAPMGNPKELPPPPKLPAAGEWAMGKPDQVLSPVRAYHLEAEGKDVYRNFTLPADFNEDRYVSAFDFKPGNRAIVHHIIAYIDVTGESAKARDNKESEPGWSVSGGGSGIKNDDWGDGWAPGMNPRRLPPGVAVKIPKGAKLVLQVHYHKTGKPEEDRSELALYYAKEPVKKVLQTAVVGNPMFALKPNVAGQEVKGAIVLPFAASVYQLLPHMHMLGKGMDVTATLPDGTTRDLIRIRNWEFNWQMKYAYKEPVLLPKGTRINLVARYDNTASNPNQPSNPPQLVRFGEQTTDEMCFCFIGFTRESDAGAPAPARAGSL